MFTPFIGIVSGALIAVFVSEASLSYGIFLRISLAAFAAALLNGASNALNQYYDVEIDRINKPERPIVQGRISKPQVLLITIILYALVLIVSFFASNNPLQTFILFLVASILTIIYSAPPLRTKRLTWGSNLTIALARGFLLIVAGWSLIASVNNIEPWILGLVFGTFIFFLASTKDLGDVKGDKKFNIKTIPVVFGQQFTHRFISLGFVAPFIVLFILNLFGFLSADKNLINLLVCILLVWGSFLVFKLNKSKINHKSLWRQMYYVMMVFQVGLIIAYYYS